MVARHRDSRAVLLSVDHYIPACESGPRCCSSCAFICSCSPLLVFLPFCPILPSSSPLCKNLTHPPHIPTRGKNCAICYNESGIGSSQAIWSADRTTLAVSPAARLSSSFIVRFKEISHAVPTSRLRRFWRVLVLGFLQRKVRSPLLGLPTALFSLASRLHRAHQFTSIAYHFDKHLIRESV